MNMAHSSQAGLSASGPATDEAAELLAADRAHVFYSWSAQGSVEQVLTAGGSGRYFWDYSGNRYLDFSSQFVNLNIGHSHPRVVDAISRQAAELCTAAPIFATRPRAEAARLVAECMPGDLDKVFFTNGGGDAVEHAVRMARVYTGRRKVLSAYRSYHGSTELSIHLTGDPRRWPVDTGSAGVVHFFPPYRYRSAFGATTDAQERDRALEHLHQTILFEGPDTIAAILLEPIIGTGGVLIPPPGYLPGVRELCDQYGILLIADEVMTGFGRTGRWFAVDHWDVEPDLMAFAKGVNSGYVPLGGVAISNRVAAYFEDHPYPGGLTYSGHPLACAAAVATIEAMREESMVENAASLGSTVIGPALERIAAVHPCVGEVRGLGVFWACELVRNRETREMLVPYAASPAESGPMREVLLECRQRGVWFFANFNRIHVLPPCNMTADEARIGLEVLDAALTLADKHVVCSEGVTA